MRKSQEERKKGSRLTLEETLGRWEDQEKSYQRWRSLRNCHSSFFPWLQKRKILALRID